MENRLVSFQEDLAQNSMSGIREKLAQVEKMEESQNFVLKDCHEKV